MTLPDPLAGLARLNADGAVHGAASVVKLRVEDVDVNPHDAVATTYHECVVE
jgi:hypothetical protein